MYAANWSGGRPVFLRLPARSARGARVRAPTAAGAGWPAVWTGSGCGGKTRGSGSPCRTTAASGVWK